jgi:hypothetical protein
VTGSIVIVPKRDRPDASAAFRMIEITQEPCLRSAGGDPAGIQGTAVTSGSAR